MEFSFSDVLIKPNLWLLVNPNIVCQLQYQQNVELQPELAQEVQTSQLEPGEMFHPSTAGRHLLPSQEARLHSGPSAQYTVMAICYHFDIFVVYNQLTCSTFMLTLLHMKLVFYFVLEDAGFRKVPQNVQKGSFKHIMWILV